MKTYLKTFFICFLVSSIYTAAPAQTTAAPDTILNKRELVIPPLTDLIDSAIKHDASVRYRNLEIEVSQANLKEQRNYWLKNLGLQADSRYGTYDNFSSNAVGQSTTLLNSTSRQFNYGIGLYIKLPVFDVVNRKTQINHAKAQVEQAKSMVEVQEDEIRQMIIKQYLDLLLKQKLLDIKSQNLGSATVNIEMVEKEFRNGVIPITEYVRLSDMTARIQSDYELAKSEFLTTKKILEEMVGFTFGYTDTKK